VLRFLGAPAAHAGHAGSVSTVETIETHMSWLFVAGEQVLKLKKPVRYPFLAFSTPAAREAPPCWCWACAPSTCRFLPAGQAGLEVRATVVETPGADTFLYFEFGGARRAARVLPEQTSRVGDSLCFGIDMRKAHLFDTHGNVLR
jgi:hypothetical protein